MHLLSDLILEGVMNSYEAGSSNIYVDIDEMKEGVSVKISDDGFFTPIDGLFLGGVSTKGSDRGIGLSLIKERDKNASLKREGNMTVLSFASPNDRSLEDRESFLLSLFVRRGDENIYLNWKDGLSHRCSISTADLMREDAIPYNAHTIANFKRAIF